MLRKLLWTAIYGIIGAVAAIGARIVASLLDRLATGEEPPVKK
jgi:hypothetical protein